MAQHKRHLLFTTDQVRLATTDDILPPKVKPPAVHLLWLGLAVVLLFLAVILLTWSHGGI